MYLSCSAKSCGSGSAMAASTVTGPRHTPPASSQWAPAAATSVTGTDSTSCLQLMLGIISVMPALLLLPWRLHVASRTGNICNVTGSVIGWNYQGQCSGHARKYLVTCLAVNEYGWQFNRVLLKSIISPLQHYIYKFS